VRSFRNSCVFTAPLVIEAKAQKPLFPTKDLERTAAVFAALLQAEKPLDAETLASPPGPRPLKRWQNLRAKARGVRASRCGLHRRCR